MTAPSFDFSALFRSDLPSPAMKWNGFPQFNFVGGHNDMDSVPIEGLIAAASRVLSREGNTLAMYGLHSGPLGYRPLREFIARKLARDAGMNCSPDEILITSGSLQGLDLVNQVFLAPGDTVIIERETYGGTITRLARLGVNAVGVPVDHDGLSAAALGDALRELKNRGIRPKFIYTIPTVQNPTATVMSEARRADILMLSKDYGVPIFEDECYSDLVWSGERPRALYAMADDDRVVHIGSFSKTIAPALRIGYIVASWPVLSRIVSIKTDGGSGALEQMILAEYCQEHFDSHVVALRKTLRRKCDVLIDALKTQYGNDIEFDYPAGGIFLWVKLPDAIDTTRLTQTALQAGIAINPGVEWMTDAGIGQRRVRLCFAQPSEQIIRDGVAALAAVSKREFGVPAQVTDVHR